MTQEEWREEVYKRSDLCDFLKKLGFWDLYMPGWKHVYRRRGFYKSIENRRNSVESNDT